MAGRGVTVAVRTRPTAAFAQDQVLIDTERQAIAVKGVTGPTDATAGPSNRADNMSFKYHHVMHNAGQDTVYETVCREAVTSAVAGTNATIMAYGQTAAGKTFTVIGPSAYKFRGIAPRALGQVFADIAEQPEKAFTVKVSYMEIYNDRIFDLLGGSTPASTDFQVVEERGRGIVVRGLSSHEVEDEAQALRLLFEGEVNRTTAEHLLNANSNRSHCIFTVHITQRSRVSGSAKVLHSKLHLVDLAGSERIKKTLHDDDTVSSDDIIIKESMHINKSLSFLEQCVVALTSKSRSHVPYRQTKLTHVLKDSLGGNCKTVFIACIWGEARHMEETVSTLRLASRMMRVKNTASTNVEMDPVMLVKKYERQVRELKQELAMHDALSDQSGKVYDEYSPEQAAKVAAEVRAYLKDEPGPDGEPATLEVDSVRKMMEVLKQVKIVVRGLEAETEERLRAKFTLRERGAGDGAAAGAGSGAGAGAGSGTAGGAGDGGDGGDGVGVLDSEGFSMGIAAADARPATAIEAPAGAGRTMPPRTLGATESKFEEPEVPADKNKAFGMYRSDPDLGGSTAEALADAKAQLKTCRADMKAQAQNVNQAKHAIDKLNDELNRKRGESSATAAAASAADGEELVVDEEEYRLMKEVGSAKKAYKAMFAELRASKSAFAEAAATVDSLTTELLDGFNSWFQDNAPPEALGGADVDEDGDAVDVGEAFDRMQMQRITAQDPDSLAFHTATRGLALKAPPGKRVTRR